MSLKVAVLGYGPAGLMAAHGAMVATGGMAELDVIGLGEKSKLHGAQYLHRHVKLLTREEHAVPVRYLLRGTVEGYREKVYGELRDVLVSPDALTATHPAWDLRQVYERLWYWYGRSAQLAHVGMSELAEMTEWYDLVFSSIPLRLLCPEGHQFVSVKVWVAGEFMGGFEPEPGENFVVCNGMHEPAWYRTATVFGHTSTEWPEAKRPPVPATLVEKPVSNRCTCWPKVVRVGRYGTWTKGVLTHHAYEEAHRACQSLLISGQSSG